MRSSTLFNSASYQLTVSESKNYLRIDVPDDDMLISALITASYEHITAECNRDFLPTIYTMPAFSASGDIFLSTQTVDSVSTGSLKEVGGSWYTFIDPDYSGPISFTVASSGSLPAPIKVAQMMLIAHIYENRLPYAMGISATPLDFTIQTLCNSYKLIKP